MELKTTISEQISLVNAAKREGALKAYTWVKENIDKLDLEHFKRQINAVLESLETDIDECPGCGCIPHADASSSHDPCSYHFGIKM